MSESMYKNIYGLTCIENHVLALLKKSGEEEQYFYFNSFVNTLELYTDIVTKQQSFYHYQGIEKIQNFCKIKGLISLQKYINNTLQIPDGSSTIFIRVTDDFNKNTLHSRAFRQDHFVIVQPYKESLYTVINDIPSTKLLMTKKEITNVYDGEYFTFDILRKLSSSEKSKIFEAGVDNIRNHIVSYSPLPIADHVISAKHLKDFIFLLRQLRKRNVVFLNIKFNSELFKLLLDEYERLFTQCQYYYMRGVLTENNIDLLISKLNNIEEKYLSIMEKVLHEY